MRQFVIAGLLLADAIVTCEIVFASLDLSRDIRRDATVGRVAHAVVLSTRHLAMELRTGLEHLA